MVPATSRTSLCPGEKRTTSEPNRATPEGGAPAPAQPRARRRPARPGREAHDLRAEPGDVVVARHRPHELDRAAGGPERERPERVALRPIFKGLELGRDPAVSNHLVH